MSILPASTTVPAPRLLLVLAGAASELGPGRTALELARLPRLTALAAAGRSARLRTVADHLPVTGTTAAAALLGTVPPVPLDAGAVAVQAFGLRLAADEGCTLVDVLDLLGNPAPALDVQRATEALRLRLTWHRIVAVRRGNQVLVAGALPPVLPVVEGLELRPTPRGFLPAHRLGADTLVIAEAGASLLGVASVLGARIEPVDVRRDPGADPIPGRLRERALAALIAGQPTVVVESNAALHARRLVAGGAIREATLIAVLEQLDRELIGPLSAAAGWIGASLAVTTDLPRTAAGRPLRGDVPLVLAGPRTVVVPEAAPLLAPLGTTPPPPYSERGASALPLVVAPFACPPPRGAQPPERFTLADTRGRAVAGELELR